MKEGKKIYIQLALKRFDELMHLCEDSTKRSSYERLYLLQMGLSLFKELVSDNRFNEYLKKIKVTNPEDVNVGGLLFALRHYFVHFPLFSSLDECYIQKDLILWNRGHSKVDRYFSTLSGCVFRFELESGDVIHASFPCLKEQYNKGERVSLGRIINDPLILIFFLFMKGVFEYEFPEYYSTNK